MVRVSGTICMTRGGRARMRCAVTVTAGRVRPASDLWRRPRSTSTMSPEVSIEPLRLIRVQRLREIDRHLLLTEYAHRSRNGFCDGRVALAGESLEFFVRRSINADGGRGHD